MIGRFIDRLLIALTGSCSSEEGDAAGRDIIWGV
jgi:hypothetical protein